MQLPGYKEVIEAISIPKWSDFSQELFLKSETFNPISIPKWSDFSLYCPNPERMFTTISIPKWSDFSEESMSETTKEKINFNPKMV